jgi:sortase A
MKDRRIVEDLDIEELERILLIKRREARLARLRQMDRLDPASRRDLLESPRPVSPLPPIPTDHRQFQGIGASAAYHSVEVESTHEVNQRRRFIQWLSVPLEINWRFIINTILFLVEAIAVAGLILIIIGTLKDQEQIKADVRELEERVVPTPTLTPAPLVRAVVLPGGHTPPDVRGFSRPEPIPEELQPLLAQITPFPVPTPGSEHARRIVIPAIGVDHRVVPGDDWEALKQGVGHTPWTANPGEVGNCVLSAYNDIYGEIFRRLPDIELGDPIFIHISDRVHRYVVRAKDVVEPTQVEFMEPTERPMLTLISSYPYLVDTERIVVIAELEDQD